MKKMEKERQVNACSQPVDGLAGRQKRRRKVSGGCGGRGRQQGWEPHGERQDDGEEEVGQGSQACSCLGRGYLLLAVGSFSPTKHTDGDAARRKWTL